MEDGEGEFDIVDQDLGGGESEARWAGEAGLVARVRGCGCELSGLFLLRRGVWAGCVLSCVSSGVTMVVLRLGVSWLEDCLEV